MSKKYTPVDIAESVIMKPYFGPDRPDLNLKKSGKVLMKDIAVVVIDAKNISVASIINSFGESAKKLKK